MYEFLWCYSSLLVVKSACGCFFAVGGKRQQAGAGLARFKVGQFRWNTWTLDSREVKLDRRAIFEECNGRWGGRVAGTEMKHDPTRVEHNQIRNDLETAGIRHGLTRLDLYSFIQMWVYVCHCPSCKMSSASMGRIYMGLPHSFLPLHNTGVSFRLWVLWPGPSINHHAGLWPWSLARPDVRVPPRILWKRNRLHTVQRHFVQWRLQSVIMHPLSCRRDAHGSSCRQPSSLQVSKGPWTRGRCVWLRYIAGARGRWRVCPLQGAEPELLRAGHGSQECACSRWLCAIGCWVGTAGLHVMWV